MVRIFILAAFLIISSCVNHGDKTKGLTEGKGIIARNGMIVSAHPEASRIGVKVLRKGGNAVDAAVATGFALAVCYPEAGNIGGGGFMVFRMADGTRAAIDFREKAPLAAFNEMFIERSTGEVFRGLSTDTHLAAGVPGSVDGLIEAHRRFGRLPFRKVIQPAVELAENGFAITREQVRTLNGSRKEFTGRNRGKTPFVKDSLWKEGDILRQPELAETLKRIRDKGRDGFYSGPTAQMITSEMERGFGLISSRDLAEYRAVWREPLEGEYRGHRIITMNLPSGGGVTLLQILSMLEDYDLGKMGFNTPESVHLVTEAERRAFADRSFHLGDPGFVFVPVDRLLSRSYLADRMESFDKSKASSSSEIRHGKPDMKESEETTHYSAVDSEGNAVAVTTTLNDTFGSCIVVEGAGFLLNNEMDDFSIKPGHPNMYGLIGGFANSIRPGKRMLSSMTPSIVEKEGKLFMITGSPGGSTIPSSVMHSILNVLDFGMNIQDAVEAPRYHHQWMPDYISYEAEAFDSTTISKLESAGHKLRRRGAIGRVNAILVLPDGSFQAGADTRGDNAAAGY